MNLLSVSLSLVNFGALLIIRTFFDKTDITVKNCLFVMAYFTIIGVSAVKSTAAPNDFLHYFLTITSPLVASMASLYMVYQDIDGKIKDK